MELYKSKYSDGKTDGRNSRRENKTYRSFRNSGDDRNSRNDSKDESTTVTCSDCGTQCTVPFVPRTNKPVYCSDCFRQNKPQNSDNDRYPRDDRNSRNDRYPRDDRNSRNDRYPRDDRNSRNDRYPRDDRNSRNDRYPRDDKSSRYSQRSDRHSRNDSQDESTTVTCSDCGTQCTVPFVPRTNKPVYCSDCFRQNKPQSSSGNDGYSRDDKSSRYSQRSDRHSRNDSQDESTTVTCSDCGTQCTVPFVPRTNKPVYCNDCFRQNKPQSSSGNDGYSRDDKNTRSYSRRESNSDNFRSKKPQNDKFLRKQKSFFSNGSDKFYETIKEKLYEILGGKTCSVCGFKDERALGISHISEDIVFDNFGRGGVTASWGKYISTPDLAKKELGVFCLNCNQIRESAPKQTEERSSPKPKKSKYFPR